MSSPRIFPEKIQKEVIEFQQYRLQWNWYKDGGRNCGVVRRCIFKKFGELCCGILWLFELGFSTLYWAREFHSEVRRQSGRNVKHATEPSTGRGRGHLWELLAVKHLKINKNYNWIGFLEVLCKLTPENKIHKRKTNIWYLQNIPYNPIWSNEVQQL